MFLERLSLLNFKNYTSADISFSPKINGMVGANGMGKTNLLDAIYYLCLCRSKFHSTDRDLVRHDQSFFRVDGYFIANDEKLSVTCKYQVRRKKEFLKNGVVYDRLSQHIGLLPVVMVTPDDTALATEGSEARRSFLDTTLSQVDPQYLYHLMRYNKTLDQRNALLKQWAIDRQGNMGLLQIYNEQMLEPAQYIYAQRKHFCTAFQPYFQAACGALSGHHEHMTVAFTSVLDTEKLEDVLEKAFDRDTYLGRSTRGIHRDDMVFMMDELPLRKFASQGQLKSFVIGLRLAQYAYLRSHKDVAPLLLLDDIFDKLDPRRGEELISMLLTPAYGQVFLTDTHEPRIQSILQDGAADYAIFTVNNGVIA